MIQASISESHLARGPQLKNDMRIHLTRLSKRLSLPELSLGELDRTLRPPKFWEEPLVEALAKFVLKDPVLLKPKCVEVVLEE